MHRFVFGLYVHVYIVVVLGEGEGVLHMMYA